MDGDLGHGTRRGHTLPLVPEMSPAIERTGEWSAAGPHETSPVDRRTLAICALAIVIAGASAILAEVLRALMGGVTNLAFFGRSSISNVSPATNHLGVWVIL